MNSSKTLKLSNFKACVKDLPGSLVVKTPHSWEFWGEWIHVYVWLSPFIVQLKLSHGSSSIQQYKSLKKKTPHSQELGGEWIRVSVWLSPAAAHLELSQRC